MDKHEQPSIHITRVDALILSTAAVILAKVYQDKMPHAQNENARLWYKHQAESLLDASQRVMEQFK